MLTQPRTNVQLTDEQTKQLQVFYTRLTNLQTETSIATKNLENIKDETVKVSMEKKQTEDMVASLKEQIKTLKLQADEHVELVAKSQQELEGHRKERVDVDARHTAKHAELTKREKELANSEENHSNLLKELHIKSSALSKERLSVEQAKEAFQKAIESVTWK